MDKTNVLKDQAYKIATDKYTTASYSYNPSTRATAMIAYALLTIAEKITKPNVSEVT